jgi:hypothetical protein
MAVAENPAHLRATRNSIKFVAYRFIPLPITFFYQNHSQFNIKKIESKP